MSEQTQLQQSISHEDLFELLVFLIMSARTGVAHSLEFSLFRTISAAARLAEVWRPNCPEEHAAFLDQFLTLVRKESPTFETDQEAFKAFLTEASRQVAIHTKQIDWGG
jgi:hypothetical protein